MTIIVKFLQKIAADSEFMKLEFVADCNQPAATDIIKYTFNITVIISPGFTGDRS